MTIPLFDKIIRRTATKIQGKIFATATSAKAFLPSNDRKGEDFTDLASLSKIYKNHPLAELRQIGKDEYHLRVDHFESYYFFTNSGELAIGILDTPTEVKQLERVKLPKASAITLTRTTNAGLLCAEKFCAQNISDADNTLRQWAKTAPDDGTHDICEILLKMTDGAIHNISFALVYSHVSDSRLQEYLDKKFGVKVLSGSSSIWCGF